MKESKSLIGAIFLLFLMLWLPIGQHHFLVEHWMKSGTYAVPFILIGVFIFNGPVSIGTLFKAYRFIAVIMLIAYIMHQFEEHWIDLFGNSYAFYDFNNNFILRILGATDATVKPLTKTSIFIINTSLVWLVGVLGILASPRHLFPLVSMASIVIVNALVHILAAIFAFQYNPGLLTSIFVFVPLYFWFLRFMLGHGKQILKLIIGGLIWALLAHVVMVAGLLIVNWYNLFPEVVYFVALVIWSVLPLGFFRLNHQISK